MKMDRKVWKLVILLGIVSIGGAIWMWWVYNRNSSASGILELQGNVEIRVVRVSFEVPGRISRMLVEEGNRVRAGQLLAELDPEPFEIAVKQAESSLRAREAELMRLQNGARPEEIARARAKTEAARVAFLNAQKEFLRAKALFASKALSERDFDLAKAERDRAEAQLKALEAAQKLIEAGPRAEDIVRAQAMVELSQARLQEAKRRLKSSRLFAPVSGIVQTRVHEPGEFVNAGEPIYTIAITDPVWVRAYINELDLGRVRPGMKAVILTDAGKSYEGHVGYISPVAEFTPKTVQTREIRTDLVYRIRLIVRDPEGELRQGMPVTVILKLNSGTENVHER